jgi:selenocysteine lyase/cysteine desulfurase
LNHDFLAEGFPGRMEPGNVNYELTASLTTVLDYLTDLGVHAGAEAGAHAAVKIERAFSAIADHEESLQAPLLDFLASRENVRVIGRVGTDRSVRVPTVSFVVDGVDSARIPPRMEVHRIGIRYGHFYAKRLIDALGLDRCGGVVRVSLVHYNTIEEVEELVACLGGAF